VGGSPEHFGISVNEFHEQNKTQNQRWPNSLLATATHDTKRGEDVRARLNVLSEMPQLWENAVWRWSRLNEDKKVLLPHGLAPHANDEYLLYQTLIGAWPDDTETAGGLKRFRERVAEYMLKAIREAKLRTSWTDPVPEYEKATTTFVERLLNPLQSKSFLEDFKKLQTTVAWFGVFNSLSQTLLKMTAPGVPDFYQGTELWDFNLVDPDNRRPVDFALRRKLLAKVKRADIKTLANSRSGETKLFTIHKTLQFRGRHPQLFEHGEYIPLRTSGPKSAHVCAFLRKYKETEVLVIVPRLIYTLCQGKTIPPLGPKVWGDTAIAVPSRGTYRNELTAKNLSLIRGKLPVSEVLAKFPIAFLSKTSEES
jgi:(1->4)-alpha-D-glucan 1-alpha-D-glucosylmutase